jgi:hypothetical protein
MNTIERAVVGVAVILCFLTISYNTPVWAETVKVCVDVKDKSGEPVKDKSGKVKQNCKTMKKHEKLEQKK